MTIKLKKELQKIKGLTFTGHPTRRLQNHISMPAIEVFRGCSDLVEPKYKDKLPLFLFQR